MATFAPPKPPTRDDALGLLYYLLDLADSPPQPAGGGDPTGSLLAAIRVAAGCVSVLPAAPPATTPTAAAAQPAPPPHKTPR